MPNPHTDPQHIASNRHLGPPHTSSSPKSPARIALMILACLLGFGLILDMAQAIVFTVLFPGAAPWLFFGLPVWWVLGLLA